jgi:hypothetical protein
LIAESQRGTANKFFPSQKNSEASTMDKTEEKADLPEVVNVDTPENKKEDEEEDFWVWQAKQEAWRKVPIFKGTPKGELRSFSCERSAARRRLRPIVKKASGTNEDKMNMTAQVILPSTIK